MSRNLHSITALAFAILLAGGSAALASKDKSVFVSGNSTFSDCGVPESDYAILLTGDLEGCLSTFIEGSKCRELADYDLYLEHGREVFIGTLNGKPGRFSTDYTFDAAYAKGFCQSFDASLEVGGGCIHKIQRGSGAFRNVEGVIKIIDVITGVTGDPVTGAFAAGTGGNNFLYYARLNRDHDD